MDVAILGPLWHISILFRPWETRGEDSISAQVRVLSSHLSMKTRRSE